MSLARRRTAPSAGRKRAGRALGSAASNSIKRIATDPGSAQREEFYDHLGRIEDIFSVSGVQAVSVNAYINSILSTGVQTIDSEPVRGMLLTTIVDLIKNLVLYGFSCYRILAFPDKGQKGMVVQVPSGKEMPVRFSSKLLRWVPDYKTHRRGTAMDLFDTSNDNVDNSDDDDEDDPFRWKTIVWMPPTESRCTSFAAQASVFKRAFTEGGRAFAGLCSHPRPVLLPTRYHDSVRIEELYKNQAERDAFNSRPNAYVSIDEGQFTARGRAGGQTFLRSGLDLDAHTGEEGMTRGMSYEDLLASRAAVMRGLAENTDRTDFSTSQQRQPRVGIGLGSIDHAQTERDLVHRELVVTEGRKAVPAPQLQSQDHLDRLIVRLRLNVLESFGVAPQFVGESVSAERVGSNAQSTSKAMEMFQIRARVLRDQIPIEDLGVEWINRPQINVFERVFPILKKKDAVQLTASVYGIEPDMIDPVRLELQQDAMLNAGNGSTASSTAPEGLKTPARRHKTESDKEITALNKGSTTT